ncbi:MAG: DUF2341 domain-containing protein [bacterium]
MNSKHSYRWQVKRFRSLNKRFMFRVGFLFLSLSLFVFAAPVEAQTISSAANQTFKVGDPATLISTITIIDNVGGTITGGKGGDDIRIRIPSSFNMIWDTSIIALTFGGTAVAKIDATKTKYVDNKTLFLEVKTTFTAGEYITVSGPKFTDFTAVSPADNLELDVDNDGAADDFDDKTITIADDSLTLADHAAGQQTNSLVGTSPFTGAQLFRFKLTNETAGVLTVDQVVFQLSSVTGIVQGDFANLEIYVDSDNNGGIEAGETTTVGGSGVVNAGVTTITFSTDFDISAGATVNYILMGDLSNLLAKDTVTMDLGTSDITLASGSVGGSATSVTHFYCGDGKFSYWRSITIDHTLVGINNTGTLPATGFPVLVSLSGNWLKTTTVDPVNGRIESDNGADIIFRKSDGETGLYHEIETYDGTNGTLVAWVRIDSLSKATDTTIYIFYGNACVTAPSEDPGNVWDGNFKGVWHLKEDTDETNEDSTQYGNDGTPFGSPESTPGKIDGALNFNVPGDATRINIPSDPSLNVPDYSNWTMSAWVKPESYGSGEIEWPMAYGFGADATLGLTVKEAKLPPPVGAIEVWFNDAKHIHGNTPATFNDWNHICVVYTPTTSYLYLNGTADGTGASEVITHSGDICYIGSSAVYPVKDDFLGIIDEVRFSGTNRDYDWVRTEFNNQDDTTIGEGHFIKSLGVEQAGPPTAIDLISFTATGRDASVRVAWETAQEIDNMGFYLYRAQSPAGPFTRLTDRLIPALSFSVMGKAYTYEDTDVIPGELYYYKLEDIDVHGTHTIHGPVCVDWKGDGMPDDWEIAYGLGPLMNDPLLDPDGDGLTNLAEYVLGMDPLNPDTDGDGIPDGQEEGKIARDEGGGSRTLTRGVQILSSDETGITVELRTDAFATEGVEALGESYERLRIPGYIHGFTEAVGAPELPMKGILLDLPEGKSAQLTVQDIQTQTHSGYRVYPVPEKVVRGEGDMAHVQEVFARDEAAYGMDAFYPEVAARLGNTYIFRDTPKLQVLFYPLAFNPATGELMHRTLIRVRVEYTDIRQRGLMDSGTVRFLAWTPPSEGPACKILVSDEGIHRLTGTELEAGGIDVEGMALSQVRLYHLGEEMAISVYDPNDNDRLDTGEYIQFYARPVDAQYAKYTKNNVYWLTTDGGSGDPKRMAEMDATPGVAADPNTHTGTVHYEEDRYYVGSAPGDDAMDRWFFDINSYPVVGAGFAGGGNPVDFTLSVPGAAGSGSLTISMWGYYDTNHVVDVSVNGAPVGTFYWSDIAFYQAAIDPVDLLAGENTVTLTCASGADPNDLDTIFVDWFDVTYQRDFSASNDMLQFSHEAGYRYRISGFTGNDLLAFDITSAADVQRIVNFDLSGSGPYTLECEPDPNITGERTYLVLSSDMTKTPTSISPDTASTLSDPENGADYILITHRDLGWDSNGDLYAWLTGLVSLREAQGLRVKVVDVQDVYDEFSYGIVTPQAIKDFLTFAYDNWTEPAPRYVLLLGDATYDYKNNLGLDENAFTYVPTYLTFTDYMGETLTDEWFVQVSGDDAAPDLYIGRLPAASADQAAVMVSKVLAYEAEANTKTWEKNTLFFADNQVEEYEGIFETLSDEAASLIPTGLNAPFKGYLGDYLAPGYLTADIKETINEGALVVNYSGHGSTQIWASEAIFKNADLADPNLANNDKLPFFINMTCLTGYFAYPESYGFPCLAEALLRSEGKGAVAALMPTGMTAPEGQFVLDTALLDAVFTEDNRELGPAVSEAKLILLANAIDFDDINTTFLLFGDPAMTLKIPLPMRPKGLQVHVEDDVVVLSWQEATDCEGGTVAGYNIYRALTPDGDFEKVNTALIIGTEYADASAEIGISYSYVVTSVDSDQDESVRSPAASTAGINALSFGGSGCFIDTIEDDFN